MLNYDVAGATRPEQETWAERPAGYRRYERTICLGQGPRLWESVSAGVLEWQVKTRSGFVVHPVEGELRARPGADCRLVARVGPLRITEPVRVIEVVDRPARCGFSYGTRNGHPVSGEEAFIVHRTPDGRVWLTLRSLTRPSPGVWGWVFPALLVAQCFYRHRYLRALRP